MTILLFLLAALWHAIFAAAGPVHSGSNRQKQELAIVALSARALIPAEEPEPAVVAVAMPMFASLLPLVSYSTLVFVIAYVAARFQKWFSLRRRRGPHYLEDDEHEDSSVELLPTSTANVLPELKDFQVVPPSVLWPPRLGRPLQSRADLFKSGRVHGRSHSLSLPSPSNSSSRDVLLSSPFASLPHRFHSTPNTPTPLVDLSTPDGIHARKPFVNELASDVNISSDTLFGINRSLSNRSEDIADIFLRIKSAAPEIVPPSPTKSHSSEQDVTLVHVENDLIDFSPKHRAMELAKRDTHALVLDDVVMQPPEPELELLDFSQWDNEGWGFEVVTPSATFPKEQPETMDWTESGDSFIDSLAEQREKPTCPVDTLDVSAVTLEDQMDDLDVMPLEHLPTPSVEHLSLQADDLEVSTGHLVDSVVASQDIRELLTTPSPMALSNHHPLESEHTTIDPLSSDELDPASVPSSPAQSRNEFCPETVALLMLEGDSSVDSIVDPEPVALADYSALPSPAHEESDLPPLLTYESHETALEDNDSHEPLKDPIPDISLSIPDPGFLPLVSPRMDLSAQTPTPPESPFLAPLRKVKPAWSLRATDAPPLGLSASATPSPAKLVKELEHPSPLQPPLALSTTLPGTFPTVETEPVVATVATTTAVEKKAARPRVTRSPIDIALAMQLRPGLGMGADPAWMVRFLMSMFGWMVVLISGSGGSDGYYYPVRR